MTSLTRPRPRPRRHAAFGPDRSGERPWTYTGMEHSATQTQTLTGRFGSACQTDKRDLAEDELHVLAEVELDEVAGGAMVRQLLMQL